MYLDPFWLGVVATIGCECVAIVIVAVIQYMKGGK